MASFNPYLNFHGNSEEAFNFYKSVFGGEFTALVRFKDMPETSNVPDNEKDKIMHISLPIGNGNVLMATDTLDSLNQKLTQGNNFYIAITPDTKQDADRLFSKLSAGGKVEMPMQEQVWGSYFGSFKDKYGIQWMIDFPTKPQG